MNHWSSSEDLNDSFTNQIAPVLKRFNDSVTAVNNCWCEGCEENLYLCLYWSDFLFCKESNTSYTNMRVSSYLVKLVIINKKTPSLYDSCAIIQVFWSHMVAFCEEHHFSNYSLKTLICFTSDVWFLNESLFWIKFKDLNDSFTNRIAPVLKRFNDSVTAVNRWLDVKFQTVSHIKLSFEFDLEFSAIWSIHNFCMLLLLKLFPLLCSSEERN